MPFTGTTSKTVFCRTEAGEGANNRKLDVLNVTATNGATVADWGTTTTARYILVKPLATNTSSSTPDNTCDDFGWNILKADMNQTANTPNRRIIRSGTWTAQAWLFSNTLDNLAAAGTYRLRVHLYKRNSTGGYSFIASNEANIPSGNITASATFTQNVTISVTSDQVFNTDETLMSEWWLRGQGILVTGQQFQFRMNTAAANTSMLNFPGEGIVTEYMRTSNTTGTGTTEKLLRTRFTRTMGATGSFNTLQKKVGAIRTFTAGGSMQTLQRKVGLPQTYSAVGTMQQLIRKVGLVRNYTATGTMGEPIKKMGLVRSFNGTGSPSVTRLLDIHRTVDYTATGTPDVIRRLVLRRPVDAISTGIVRIFAKLPIEKIPGGAAITKKIFYIFDD